MSRAGRGGAGQPWLPLGADSEPSAAELEAELLELVGKPGGRGGRAPVPMEAIEKMAALCMRDPGEEEEEDEDVEGEEELMAELHEVLGDGGGGAEQPEPPGKDPPAPPPDLRALLEARAVQYGEALRRAAAGGDGLKERRCQRGLKTLQSMLAAVQRGQAIAEADIPPPVALGLPNPPPQNPPPQNPPSPNPSAPPPNPTTVGPPSSSSPPAPPPSPKESEPPPKMAAVLRERQRGYKMAALGAKRRGDLEAAAGLYRVAKSLEPLVAAAELGRPVPPDRVPPAPEQHPAAQPAPTPPRPPPVPSAPPEAPGCPPAEPGGAEERLAELRRRMEPYCNAAAQARSRGEERKARMHERIVKQYQDAIRALQAGRDVDLTELPVPPGFQPPSSPAPPGPLALLDAALSLAQAPGAADDADDDDGDDEGTKPPPPPPPPARAAPAQSGRAAEKGSSSRAQQQLQFLEGRRQQLQEAALRCKRLRDLDGAKRLLRQAKAVAAMMEAARGGLPVDVSTVPEAPPCDEDFVLVRRRGAGSAEVDGRHAELMERLRRQHEMCVRSSRQFAQLGNMEETAKLELLAQECRRSAQVLQQSRMQGGAEPQSRCEQRSFSAVKTFPELSAGDLLLSIVRGANLPAPPGVAPSDLDVFVRFEFQHPSAEEAQRNRTAVVKNSDCPEFRESFKLHINRGHRGLRRVLQGKGIKFEVTHKGGLFKADRLLGAAQLKLEALERRCEVREMLEVLDGRRPTGGRLEVAVRIREPLSCPQLETRTERWLLLLPGTETPVNKGRAPAAPLKDGSRSRAVPPCLSLLSFDCERLERKLQALRRAQLPVPPAMQQQHQELAQRLQALRSQLQHCGTARRTEYRAQLERSVQHYSEAARRLGTEGHREAAKEALYRRNLVESELQKFRC